MDFVGYLYILNRYVNLSYYKQRSLLRVSATYFDHLQGGLKSVLHRTLE
jgi:hypothetical protein